MMGERRVGQEALFYEFSLERHVPETHLLRSIDRFVELDGVRRELAPFYSEVGRPSIDPELLIRMLIVGYCLGIRSERRVWGGGGPHPAVPRVFRPAPPAAGAPPSPLPEKPPGPLPRGRVVVRRGCRGEGRGGGWRNIWPSLRRPRRARQGGGRQVPSRPPIRRRGGPPHTGDRPSSPIRPTT